MNKVSILILLAFAVIALVSLACTNEENSWDNGSFGNNRFGQTIRFTVSFNGQEIIRNGTLEKGFRGIEGYSLNLEWKDEYRGRANELQVSAVGNIPQDIVEPYNANGTKTVVKLLIRSPLQFGIEGPTPITNNLRGAQENNDLGNVISINTADVEAIIQKFDAAFTAVALTQGLDQSPVIFEPIFLRHPELDPEIPLKGGEMVFQINNKTNGRWRDDEIYIVILGNDPLNNRALSYVDKDGNMVPVNTGMNQIPSQHDGPYADVSFKLSDMNWLRMPNVESGRMFFSYEKPILVQFHSAGVGEARLTGHPVTGWAGPSITNPADPNFDTYWEVIEFTIFQGDGSAGRYWGNTTRVDFFSFPVVTRLYHEGGGYRTVGEIGTRDEIFAAWQRGASGVPQNWRDGLLQRNSSNENFRIIAPGKGAYLFGGEPGGYGRPGNHFASHYDEYIDYLWDKWSREDVTFWCGDIGQLWRVTGRVGSDGILRMVREGREGHSEWGDIQIRKPTTLDAFEGRGALAEGLGTATGSLAVQAQLCAAIVRGIAHVTSHGSWGPSYASYFQPSTFGNNIPTPINWYAKFMHDHSIGGYAYSFCYADVFDHATLLYATRPTALVVDLRW
jgi:hypothetical protein